MEDLVKSDVAAEECDNSMVDAVAAVALIALFVVACIFWISSQ